MTAPQHEAGEAHPGCGFPPAHWSVVLNAARSGSPGADQALANLCEAYWYPLYAFLRHRSYPPEEAEDLTQEFLARLIRKHYLDGLTQEGGKFRSFLLTALKRYLANERDRNQAQKRGGGKAMISIDADADARYRRELIEQTTPEALFERQWAFTVMDQVQDEYGRAGKGKLFELLQGCLPGADGESSYTEACAALDMKGSSARMAALRLRRRYGQLLREEIAKTVLTPQEVDLEIRHLIEVARGG